MNGSAAQHRISGQTGVIVRSDRTRVWVQTAPRKTACWYRASITLI